MRSDAYSVSQKKSLLRFSGVGIFNKFFTHLLRVPIYARLQIFIQLSPTLTHAFRRMVDILSMLRELSSRA